MFRERSKVLIIKKILLSKVLKEVLHFERAAIASDSKIWAFASLPLISRSTIWGAANYGDIPSGLYYNHAAVTHVDTEICTVLFRETVTPVVLVCSASSIFLRLQSELIYLAVSLSSLSHPAVSELT